MDYLMGLVRSVGTVVGGSSRQMEVLIGKVNACLGC